MHFGYDGIISRAMTWVAARLMQKCGLKLCLFEHFYAFILHLQGPSIAFKSENDNWQHESNSLVSGYNRHMYRYPHYNFLFLGTPKPSIYWWINGMPAPLGLVLDSTFSLANDDRQMSSGHWSLPPSSEAVSSTLSVGVVQRGDVDTTYTCLASNSNMTQASRATLHLQLNRKHFHFFVRCDISFPYNLKICHQFWPIKTFLIDIL